MNIGLEDIKLLSNDAAMNLRIRKQAFQLELSLVYSKTNAAVELSPSAQHIKREIVSVVDDVSDTLVALPCLHTAETGHARETQPLGRSRVFPECLEYIVPTSLESLSSQLETLLQIPAAVQAEMSKYSKILKQESKKYNAWLKSEYDKEKFTSPIEVYRHELTELAEAKKHVEDLLFENTLCLGPFLLHVSVFKA